MCLCACTCVCLCVLCISASPFLPGLPVEPVWPHRHPRVGSLPNGEAHCAGQGCVPVLPLNQCICTLSQNLARCPRTTPEVGWWLRGFRRASSTVLVQQARHRHVASCVVYWGFHSWWCSRQRGGLDGLLNLAISSERIPLTHSCHRPPPGMPFPGINPTTFRLKTYA